ncbi:outer membrane beta-barrel protein [Methylocystis sp. IM3]|uniref:outer membrane protein n=1 Tax=unclassified Methylocystis TaxID=2625913 RepID=UPI0030F9C5EA
MKKIALSFAALAVTAGSALAADLPSRKGPAVLPPPPPPPPMWTGFYVGLNAGGTWANSNQQTMAVGPIGADPTWATLAPAIQPQYLAAFSAAASATGVNSGSNGGFIGGGQIGYNWQFYNNFVVGLEADIQGIAGNSGSRTVANGVTVGALGGLRAADGYASLTTARGSLDYLGTVRGRLGWLFTPTLLVYGTGGLAYGGVTLNAATVVTTTGVSPWALAQPASFGSVNFSNTQVGWTAGGGLEWMFMPNWSAKVEYLYYDLGTVTQNFALVASDPVAPTGNALFGGQVRGRLNGNIVRAGLNYHFNWGAPAPVVAKY